MTISLIIGILYLKDKKSRAFFKIKGSVINNEMRKWLGIVWIFLALAAAYLGIFRLGIPKMNSGSEDDLIFGIILTFFISPVAAAGLFLFGKYSLQGEYDD
jgi:hypothetical protein